MKKGGCIAVITVFMVIILGFAAAKLLLPDKEYSLAERRSLSAPPQLSADRVLDRRFQSGLEDWLLDQFPARESFRTLKALFSRYVMLRSEDNDIYEADGALYELDYPLDESQVQYAVKRINGIIDDCPDKDLVYFSLIPDKNYFAADASGMIKMDYPKMQEMLSGINAKYIDISAQLSCDDYYRTDSHWRQERIIHAAQELADGMGASFPETEYEEHALYPFRGVYLGRSALKIEPDTLCYLTSKYTDAARMQSAELEGEYPVYDEELFSNVDGYDVFLRGAQALVTITCEAAPTRRALVIFRDSFGSSIAPLFLGAYSRITLVDLRYISGAALSEYMELDDADILFLYSTSLINSARVMR